MKIDIKPAQINQIEEMSEVINSTWNAVYKNLISEDDMAYFIDFERRKCSFESMLDNGTIIFNIICDGKISGVVSCGKTKYNGICEIIQLYVLPSYQNKGFGRKLLCHALRFMRKSGFKEAILWVMESNKPAIDFYEKFGFHYDNKREKSENFKNENYALRYRIEL